MKKFTKKYQLWKYSDGQYHPVEFDSLDELISLVSECYSSDFYITQRLDIEIKVKE